MRTKIVNNNSELFINIEYLSISNILRLHFSPTCKHSSSQKKKTSQPILLFYEFEK